VVAVRLVAPATGPEWLPDYTQSIERVLNRLSSSGGATWGGITGTLSDQTDLQTALDEKQATLTGTGDVPGLTAALAGKVPTTRTISTTAPLTGGGDLSADRTLAIDPATTSAAGSMSAADKAKLDGLSAGLVLIGSNTFAGSTSTFTFSSIAGTYSALMLIAVLRSTISATGGNVGIRFNGDTGNNYIRQVQNLVNTTTSGAAAVSQSSMASFAIPGNTAPSGAFGRAEFKAPGYALTVNQKRIGGLSSYRVGNAVGNLGSEHSENEWLNTAAITSLTIFETGGNNFADGSTVWLYGLP